MGLATKSYFSVTLVRKYKTYHDCLMIGNRIGLLPHAHVPTAGHVFSAHAHNWSGSDRQQHARAWGK